MSSAFYTMDLHYLFADNVGGICKGNYIISWCGLICSFNFQIIFLRPVAILNLEILQERVTNRKLTIMYYKETLHTFLNYKMHCPGFHN